MSLTQSVGPLGMGLGIWQYEANRKEKERHLQRIKELEALMKQETLELASTMKLISTLGATKVFLPFIANIF